MKNIETLAKKQNFEENNEQNLKIKKNIIVNNFKEVADLFLQKKEILLFNNLFSHVHLVSFKKDIIYIYIYIMTHAPVYFVASFFYLLLFSYLHMLII